LNLRAYLSAHPLERVQERELVQQRGVPQKLTHFSFSDEVAKCKVYIDVGTEIMYRKQSMDDGGLAYVECGVSVFFSALSCLVRVFAPKPDGSGMERWAVTLAFESEIVPETCTYKVDRAKDRVTLTLKKVNEKKKWHLSG
jgi:hypothetical protein